MKIAKYFVVGGIAAVVDFSIFATFAWGLGLNYLLVGATGFLVATLVNYLISIRFVFESGSRFSKHQEILAVYLVSGVGLLLHQLLLYATIDRLGLHLMIGKILATGSVFLWNFSARHYFIFPEGRN